MLMSINACPEFLGIFADTTSVVRKQSILPYQVDCLNLPYTSYKMFCWRPCKCFKQEYSMQHFLLLQKINEAAIPFYLSIAGNIYHSSEAIRTFSTSTAAKNHVAPSLRIAQTLWTALAFTVNYCLNRILYSAFYRMTGAA